MKDKILEARRARWDGCVTRAYACDARAARDARARAAVSSSRGREGGILIRRRATVSRDVWLEGAEERSSQENGARLVGATAREDARRNPRDLDAREGSPPPPPTKTRDSAVARWWRRGCASSQRIPSGDASSPPTPPPTLLRSALLLLLLLLRFCSSAPSLRSALLLLLLLLLVRRLPPLRTRSTICSRPTRRCRPLSRTRTGASTLPRRGRKKSDGRARDRYSRGPEWARRRRPIQSHGDASASSDPARLFDLIALPRQARAAPGGRVHADRDRRAHQAVRRVACRAARWASPRPARRRCPPPARPPSSRASNRVARPLAPPSPHPPARRRAPRAAGV